MIHKRTGIIIPYFLSIIFFSLSYLFSGYSQATSNVVVVQPGFQLCQQFRETSVRITCPSCSSDVLTSTHYEAGTFTWVACLIIAFVGYVFLYLNTPLLEFQRLCRCTIVIAHVCLAGSNMIFCQRLSPYCNLYMFPITY